MSTELKTNASGVQLTRFWGGQKGTCVQVSTLDRNFVQLNRQQALKLAEDLKAFGEGRETDFLGNVGGMKR